MLSVLTYAARYSAFNPIEHLRSPLSNALAGVIQPSCVPGESLPPAKQSTKTQTPEERRSEEKIVFDNAMSTCSAHWKNTTFDNFPINVHIVKCNQDELLFNDYEEVKKFLSCPLRDLHKYSKLNKEFQEMLNHIDRHLNEIVFTKCTNKKCCDSWISKEVFSFMKDHGIRLFAPTYNETTDGHYETFLKTCIATKHQYGDFGQPSKDLKKLGKCTSCPTYSFKWKTEKARHIGVFHRRRKNKVDKPKNHTCGVCEAAFSSISSLNSHKKVENHTDRAVKRNRTENSQCLTKKPRKSGQRPLQDYLRQQEKATTATNQKTDDDDDDDDSLNEECEANECLINDEKLDGDIINCTWLECIKCSSWFHAYCVNIDLSPSELENFDYVCAKCSL